MKLARQLAQRITALNYEDLPPEAVYWSKVALLDTLGVMLAGAVEEAPGIVEDVLGLQANGGPCLLVGANRRAAPLDAALINGTSAHVLDFDNTESYIGGHVSAVMVPALLAAGEAFGASGRDLLHAHTVGFEVGARIGRGVNYYHTEKGWHPTWTLGVFAVTAACARLLNGIKFDNADPFNAMVKVTLTDGTTLSAAVDYPLGRTSANPIALADLKAKFENCALRALTPQAVAVVSRAVDSFEDVDSVRDFMTLLAAANADLNSARQRLQRRAS